MLAARGRPALDAAAAEVASAGGDPLVVPTDVCEWEQVQALAVAALERFGRIDTWVNGASVTTYGDLVDVPTADIARALQINLLGQVHGLKAALTVMREQRSGTSSRSAPGSVRGPSRSRRRTARASARSSG